MYTDDPVRDAMHRDRDLQKWRDNLPKCECCHQPIQDYDYYEIEGVKICNYCLRDYCDTEYRVENTEL